MTALCLRLAACAQNAPHRVMRFERSGGQWVSVTTSTATARQGDAGWVTAISRACSTHCAHKRHTHWPSQVLTKDLLLYLNAFRSSMVKHGHPQQSQVSAVPHSYIPTLPRQCSCESSPCLVMYSATPHWLVELRLAALLPCLQPLMLARTPGSCGRSQQAAVGWVAPDMAAVACIAAVAPTNTNCCHRTRLQAD